MATIRKYTLTDSRLDAITKLEKLFDKTVFADIVDKLLEYAPVIQAIQEKRFTIDESVDAITNHRSVKPALKGKNYDAFHQWKDKLFAYNDTCPENERVFITQKLFLNLIGGNVNTISKVFVENQKEIQEHNEKHNLNSDTNYTLSRELRRKEGEAIAIADWIKSKLE